MYFLSFKPENGINNHIFFEPALRRTNLLFPPCRWEYEELLIDIMPCGAEVLGFSNRWYVEGLKNLIVYTLPSGRKIDIFSPLYLLASKIEAFLGRGQSFYFSKDIEDIIVLLDASEA